ncbi:MAG: hypothetical protein OHK93_003297 [Ramalina farinacea]|uniref:Fatty acid desaturase domain-containing protein n=1 Tax=Ramalina farinacea TaxID=258253 RepID=A0AA43QT49_9LECA|nr:hypothetical protein [Ramalina farinacea]
MTSLNSASQQATATLKDLHGRNNFKALAAIASNYAVSALCITIVESVPRPSYPSYLGILLLYSLATLIIASRMRALENLVHEASHYNLFTSTLLHRRTQCLYAFPVFRILEDYRHSHIIHHKYLGDPLKDPDIIRINQLGLDQLPERPIWYLVGLPMTGYLTYEYLTTTFREFWTSPHYCWRKVAYWASIMLTLWYLNAWERFAYYYLVPLFVVLPVTRYWSEASEHVGLDLRGDFGSSRTNIGFIHTWFMNPHNDGYHAVHHLQSQIPFHRLPQAHQQLMEGSIEFAKSTVISHGMLETFRQLASSRTVLKHESKTL